MYDQSLGEIRDAFWKTFGRYMSLVPSASGQKINWINYRTGNKFVRFVLEVEDKNASIQLIASDPGVFETLHQLHSLFITIAGRDWLWENERIITQLSGKDIRRHGDWPELISFFKERLITLDKFWEEVKDAFVQ